MNLTLRFAAVAALVALLNAPARAQGVFQTTITLSLPTVLPPMVVVQPGVQVVEDLDEEVFFVDGWYWARRDARWYRARDYRRTWIYAEPRFVPHSLALIPPGHYRRFRRAEWKAIKAEEKARHHEARENEHERRREIREDERERRHEEKEWKKEQHKEWKKEHKRHEED